MAAPDIALLLHRLLTGAMVAGREALRPRRVNDRTVTPYEVADALSQLGVCARCTLRLLGLVPSFVYALPAVDVQAGMICALTLYRRDPAAALEHAAFLTEAAAVLAPEPTDFVCAACMGLAQGACSMIQPALMTRAQAAATKWTQSTTPSPLPFAATAAAVTAHAEAASDYMPRMTDVHEAAHTPSWPLALAHCVASSGYDLRGGVSVGVAQRHAHGPHSTSVETDIEASAAALHTKLLAAMRLPFLPWPSVDLRLTLRGMASLALSSISVPRCFAGERARTPVGAAQLQPLLPLHTAFYDGVGAQVHTSEDAVQVDLGWGCAGRGETAAQADLYDVDDAAVSALLGAWPRDHSHIHDDGSTHVHPCDERCATAGHVPLPTSSSSSLWLTLCMDALHELQSESVKRPHMVTAVPSSRITLYFTLERAPLFITAAYCKYARGCSQSAWGHGRTTAGSVEEHCSALLCEAVTGSAETAAAACAGTIHQPVIAAFTAPQRYTCSWLRHASHRPPVEMPPLPRRVAVYRFHAAGREDIDVRMLGNGRACMVELLDAKRVILPLAACAALQHCVNAHAREVVELKFTFPGTRAEFEALDAGSSGKRKTYVAVCITSAPRSRQQLAEALDAVRNVRVVQRTPMRVMHRRAIMDRHKVVYSHETEWINPRAFLLKLDTSAGTYVKEYVHGDHGRTRPNVGELLGCDADILQLDVLGLHMPHALQPAVEEAAVEARGAEAAGEDDEDEDDGGD